MSKVLSGYCVKCRDKKEIPQDAEVKHYEENNRYALKFECPDCRTKLTRFTSKEDIDALKQ